MNMKQFTGYCYDQIAQELGFVRYLNGYYKVTGRAIAAFFLDKYCGQRFVRPLMEIMPLCGVIPTSSTGTWNMHQVDRLYWLITDNHPELEFSSRTSKENNDNVRDILLDMFHLTEEPFLTRVHDLQSGFEALCDLEENLYRGTPNPHPPCYVSPNYWGFLLALKRYDEALSNFNAWAAALKHDLPEDDMSGILQRMLTEKRYEEIDAMMQKREEENMELLKQYHII